MLNKSVCARRTEIAKLIQDNGFCRSSELSELFNVSPMTIRRDIHWLEEEGLVQSVHGGARATVSRTGDYSFDRRLKENQDAKRAVARLATDLIEPNTIIALDAGTTVLEFSRLIPSDLRLTVVTYSLPVMAQLSNRDDIALISIGGELSKTTQSFVGPLATLALNELRISTLFLATKAIQDGALYSGNPYDAEIKRGLIDISDQIVLLVDSSKFNATAGIRVARLEEIDVIVVDDGLEQDQISTPENVKLVIAPVEK